MAIEIILLSTLIAVALGFVCVEVHKLLKHFIERNIEDTQKNNQEINIPRGVEDE